MKHAVEIRRNIHIDVTDAALVPMVELVVVTDEPKYRFASEPVPGQPVPELVKAPNLETHRFSMHAGDFVEFFAGAVRDVREYAAAARRREEQLRKDEKQEPKQSPAPEGG